MSSIKFKLAKYKRDFELGKLNVESFTNDSQFVDSIIQNVRGVSHDLSPQQVVKFGLCKAIETFTANIDDIECMVVSELDEEKYLTKSNDTFLYEYGFFSITSRSDTEFGSTQRFRNTNSLFSVSGFHS